MNARGRALRLGVTLGVTGAFLAAALWGMDPAAVLGAMAEVRWGWMVPVVGAYAAGHALRAVRLGGLLGPGPTFGALFRITAVGLLAINVVPARLGELVRPYLLLERCGVPVGTSLAAVVVERVLDVFVLLLMLAGIAWWVDLPATGVVVAGVDVVRAGRGLAAFGVVAGFAGLAVVALAGSRLEGFAARVPRVGASLATLVAAFRSAIARLAARPLLGLALVALSVAIWTFTIVGVDLSLRAFAGLPTGPGPALAVWGVVLAGITVAPTPGFVGAFEACCVAALVALGAPQDASRAFALVLHGVQFLFLAALGGACLLVEGWSMRELLRAARAR